MQISTSDLRQFGTEEILKISDLSYLLSYMLLVMSFIILLSKLCVCARVHPCFQMHADYRECTMS